MSREVFHVGVDHHLAPLDVREHIALDQEGAEKVSRAIAAERWASELAIVSTCNRTELYVVSDDAEGGALALGAWLRHVPAAPTPESGCYRHQSGPSAIKHLLRVACGLESAILGETEIQGQVRTAHERGQALQTLGPVLDRLFQAAIRAGKRARSETPISEGGISHGSAAAQVVRRIFDSLAGRRVLVVGAGQMASQAARAVSEVGEMDFAIANRTRSHAEELAAQIPHTADVHDLDELHDLLPHAHVVIFGGGARTLTTVEMKAALKKRRDPLLVIDLGVPRYVEAAAGDLPGMFLYDLEALEQLVANALATRREAVPAVEAIVQKELADFTTWQRGRRAMPAIRTLNEWAESIRQSELSWLPEDLPPETRAHVEKLTKRLVKRLLGRAAARVVKGHGEENPNLPTADDLRSVFGLDEGEKR